MTPGQRVKGNEAEILIGWLNRTIDQIRERGIVAGTLLGVTDLEAVEATQPGDEVRNYRPGNKKLLAVTWEYERDGP